MMIIDAIFHFYLIIIQILKQGIFSNGPTYTYLSDINIIERYMNQEAAIGHLITQIGIFFIYVMIITTFLIFIYQTWSLKSLNNSQTLKKIMTVIYASFMTFMHIPMMLLVFSNFFLDFKNSTSTLKILIFCFSGINCLFFVLMTVFLYKLYIIRIPCRNIPWSASNTQLHFMKVINKILLVVCHLYISSTGSNILVLECILCLLFTVTGLARIFIIPHYVKLVDWITKLSELSTGLLIFIMIITQTFIHDLKICILLGILMFPCVFGAAVIVDVFRQRQLLKKCENQNIRLEIENEYLLYILIEMARNSMGWDDKSQYYLSNILYLIEIHNRTCQNYQCPCHARQIVQYLLNKGFSTDHTVVEVDESEINFLNSAGEDVFIQTNKNSASSKTFTVFQVNNIYQDYGDNKNQMKDREDQGQTVQINLNSLKLTFLNKFIDVFFEDAKKKFPGSKRLFFQYAYFTLYSCKNNFLTETLIRNFDNMKVNWLEKVSIKVNELQTVMEIRQISTLNSNHGDEELGSLINWGIVYESDQNLNLGTKSYNTNSFDPENFILMSLLTNKYYNTIEKLTQNIQGFWKKIQTDTIDVFSSYKESMKVAKKIAKIYDVFEEIENEGKKQDFKLYYVFALIQKFLLNDLVSHDMYLNKMNSQRDINRLIRSNLQVAKIEDTGFMLSHGSDKNFGRIILCNQVFRKNLSYSQKDLKHANINSFMPHLIKDWHAGFVSDFNRTGTNGVLNRNTCVFVIKKSGYSVPAMMNIRFHYSKDYEFTFICFLTFMHDMQIQKNAYKTKTDQILFFLCDDVDGRIYDISESCFKQLKLNISYLQNNELGSLVNHLKIEDVCPGLSIRKLKELRKASDNILAIEEIFDINLNIIQELGNSTKIHQSKIQKALCQVFQEGYGQNKDKVMNIVAITLLDQLEMKNYLNQKNKNRKMKRELKMEQENIGKINGTQTQSLPAFSDSNSAKNNSGSSGSSLSGTGTSTEVLKQLYQTTEKKTPGSLKLISQLLFVVYVIMITVSTINLILALSRNDNLKTEVNTVRKSYDRIAYHAKTRLLLRGMVNMANGYEPLYSELSNERFKMFQTELQKQTVNLKDVQDFLDKVPFDYSDEFAEIIGEKNVILYYLDNQNKEYTENQTHSYSNNLYIQRILDVQNWGINDLKGNISLMNLKKPPEKYSPSEKERTIYFLIKNAQTYLRFYDQVFSNLYKDETIEHALDVTQQTQITIIISIAAIFVVSVVISPVLCRIEERKYIGLKFFIFVEHEHIAVLLSNCEQFLQLAFSDSSVHTASSHQETNIIRSKKLRNMQDNQNNFMDSDQVEAMKNRADGGGDSSSSEEHGSGVFEESSDSSLGDYASMYSQQEGKIKVEPLGSLGQAIETYLQNEVNEKITASGVQLQQSTHEINNHISIGEDDEDSQNNNLGTSQLDEHNNTSQMTLHNNKLDTLYQNLQDNSAPIDYKQLQQQKFNGIKSMISKKKTQTIIGVCLICVSVSSYFIACFFLAEKSFSQTPDILRYLDLVYFKDACLENAMAFVRENQIQNLTLTLVENPTVSAATYFINDCQDRESQYIEMRKNVPPVFAEYSNYIYSLETDSLCKITQTTQQKVDDCNKVFNGLLKKGISYTMNLLLNHFQNVELNFESYPPSRTYETLIQYNKNEQTLRLTELKDFILDNIFVDLKDKATLSTTNYYATLISYYTIIYGIFVVVMTFFILHFFIFQFKNIRDAMWKTNLTLKIMPMDFVPNTCLPDLKKFFNG